MRCEGRPGGKDGVYQFCLDLHCKVNSLYDIMENESMISTTPSY